jgi:dipeptidyl-peptidase-4
MKRGHLSISILAVFIITALGVVPAAAGEPSRLKFTDIVPDEDMSVGVESPAWSLDGTRLAYLYSDGEGRGLWVLDPSRGEPELLIRQAQVNEGVEIDAFRWSPQGEGILLQSGGDLFLLSLEQRKVKRLTSTAADESVPRFSPDGKFLSFVRDHDLWVRDLAAGKEMRLTKDGKEGSILNGETDWVYWEEIWGRKAHGHWWGPDSRRIAFCQFDETEVGSYPMVDFMPRYPEVTWQKYPLPGGKNSVVRIGILDVTDHRTVWMKTGGKDAYLVRAHWTPAGDGLAIQRLSREQDRLDLMLCDPDSGKCRTILTEKWPTWVNVGDDLAFLEDGRFIWGSDGSGWRQLSLHDAEGKLIRKLSPDGWSVTSLDAVNEKKGWIMATAFATEGMGAAQRHVLRIPLEGAPAAEGTSTEPSGFEILTELPGWNTALVASGSGNWLHTWSDADTPPRRAVRGPDLTRPVPLPGLPWQSYDPAVLPRWRFFTIETSSGARLPARALGPLEQENGEKRPVIMYHYGGPGSQVVVNRSRGRGLDLWHKMMAQKGYVILNVDNEASAFFGKHGEDRQHRRLGEVNLKAQLAAVEFLKGLPFVDGERIGLWGWSGGGTATLYCLLNRQGVWRAGVAVAPVTDWKLYDSIWTERYLDSPSDNPYGYADSSPTTYAANLKDALLIVHGTADDNVHPQNTLVMIRKFLDKEVPFEDAIYPRQKHGFRSVAYRHFYRRLTRFFDEHLGEE